MTREEAIKVLEKVKRVAEIYESEDVEAYNMAIELLEQEPCDCSTCANKDEVDGSNCYECVKGIQNNYEQEPYEDAISRQAVLNTLDNMDKALDVDRTVENYKELLRECYKGLLPTTPQPKIGHWIGIDEEPHEDYECDNCGYVVSTYTANIKPHTEYKYCPNCGVKMEIKK